MSFKLIQAIATDTGTTTEHRTTPCPYCKAVLDCSTGLASQRPTPKQLSVCFKCAGFLVYNDDLSVRPLTDAEFAELHPQNQTDLMSMRAIFRSTKLMRLRRRTKPGSA